MRLIAEARAQSGACGFTTNNWCSLVEMGRSRRLWVPGAGCSGVWRRTFYGMYHPPLRPLSRCSSALTFISRMSTILYHPSTPSTPSTHSSNRLTPLHNSLVTRMKHRPASLTLDTLPPQTLHSPLGPSFAHPAHPIVRAGSHCGAQSTYAEAPVHLRVDNACWTSESSLQSDTLRSTQAYRTNINLHQLPVRASPYELTYVSYSISRHIVVDSNTTHHDDPPPELSTEVKCASDSILDVLIGRLAEPPRTTAYA